MTYKEFKRRFDIGTDFLSYNTYSNEWRCHKVSRYYGENRVSVGGSVFSLDYLYEKYQNKLMYFGNIESHPWCFL